MTNPYDNTALDINTAPLWADPSDFAPSTQDDTPGPIAADGRPAVWGVYAALWGYLRRPLKVIDLGHSPHRQHFPHFIMDPEAASVWPDSCDLMLCSVPRQGEAGRVREALLDAAHGCAKRVGVLLFETVWDGRTAEQRNELPDELKRLRSSFAFVHTVSESNDSGTPGRWVLLFCSNRYWYADGRLGAFGPWTGGQTEVALFNRQDTRRYFLNTDVIVKNFLFFGAYAGSNRSDVELETSFLSAPPIEGKSIPRIVALDIGGHTGVLVIERLPGIRLSTVISRKMDYNPALVLMGLLDTLETLERLGLYHNDVEQNNVLINDDGTPALIDFASITGENRSPWMPYSLVLCFFLFAQNVINRRLPADSTVLFPFIPFKLPRHYRRWAALVWTHPPEQRNFALLKTCLETAFDGHPRNHLRSGISGKVLRSYRRFLYWRTLIALQMCFLPGWVKQGGLRRVGGRALDLMIRSFTARPLTTLAPIVARQPQD